MGRLSLVLGGQKSGKSSYAATQAAGDGGPVVVVTPAAVRDEEMRQRVARHQADRPLAWTTVESFDLPGSVHTAPAGATVVIDALDTWLAEVLLDLGFEMGERGPAPEERAAAEAVVVERLRELATVAHQRPGRTIVIAGQPGLGVHAAGRGARAYVDVHGLAVQTLSAAAADANLLIGGRPVPLGVPARPGVPPGLREHGDTQVPAGCLDLAVNVLPGPPTWLAKDLAAAVSADLAAYPDDGPARAAAAARHGRPPGECLVVAGAAEAFWLLPRVVRPRLAACVHPSFTEPEAALRAAGTPVIRIHRDPGEGWAFDPTDIPDDADLVVLGRPDNPTGVVDDLEVVAELCRPGRTVVVDEAFAEFLDHAGGVASRRDLPGVLSIRSLTKLWGLAGLRVGYVTGPPGVIARMDAARQPWSSSTPALVALQRLVSAEAERRERAVRVARHRRHLVATLQGVPDLTVWDGGANFVLLRSSHPDLRVALLEHGIAARRGDTFPGLDRHYLRLAVREPEVTDRVVTAIRAAMEAGNAA